MKKSILTKLSALGVVFVMAAIAWVTCLNVPTASTAGAATIATSENAVVVTENVKPASYLGIAKDYGTLLKFPASGTSVTFSRTFTIADGENDIIKLASHPMQSEVGKRLVTSNIERLVVKVEKVGDEENNFFAIDFGTSFYTGEGPGDWTYDGITGLRAYAKGQKVLGEDNNSTKNLRANGTPTNFSFNRGRENDVIGFKYNATTTEVTCTKGTNGDYPEAFRKFNKESAADSVTWNGFTVGDEVKVTVSVVDNITLPAEIFVYTVGGKPAIEPMTASVTNKAIAYDSTAASPVSYTLPEPKVFDVESASFSAANEPVSLATMGSAEYKIEKLTDGEPVSVQDWTAYSDAATSTNLLTEESTYKISYRVPKVSGGSDYYSTSVDVEVVSQTYADEHPVVVTPVKTDWSLDTCIPNAEYQLDVAANVESGMDMTGYNTTSAKYYLYKDTNANGVYDDGVDTESTNDNLVGGAAKFELPSEGTFFVVYEGSDGLGRTARSAAYPIVSSFTNHDFAVGMDKVSVAFGSNSVYFTPSKNDISFYDWRLVGVDYDSNLTVVISVKKPDAADYVTYDANFSFNALGEYKVKYDLSYSVPTDSASQSISCTLERTLTVVDVVPPTLSATRIPTGTVLDTDKTTDAEGALVVYLRAKKGTTITLPSVSAFDSVGTTTDLNDRIQYSEIVPGGTKVFKTDEYKNNKANYTVGLSLAGEYVFNFSVADSAGMINSLTYIVDVRDQWLAFDVQGIVDEVQASGNGVIIPSIKVVDINGNAVSGGTVTSELILGDTVVKTDVSGKTIEGLKPGQYKLVYTVTESTGVSYQKSFDITVSDTSKPDITALNVVKSGKTGKPVSVASFAATDNDVVKLEELSVTLNGETINIYGGAFTPLKPGKYVVSYTAEDVSGNVGVYTYIVNVTGKAIGVNGESSGLPVWALVLIIVGVVIVLAGIAFAVLVVLNKKGVAKIAFIDKIVGGKKASTESGEAESEEATEASAEETSDEE